MNQEELRALIDGQSDRQLLGPCLRDATVPYVFAPKPASWPIFKQQLSTNLSVSVDDISIVGSGRLGFSLKPSNNLRPFSDRSDVDVVVVNAERFDDLWHKLLQAIYPRDVPKSVGGWLADRQKEVYTGWISPLDIGLDRKIFGSKAEPVIQIRFTWFDALKKGSSLVARRHKDVKGRLYRTWEHAEAYHVQSIRALRASLKA